MRVHAKRNMVLLINILHFSNQLITKRLHFRTYCILKPFHGQMEMSNFLYSSLQIHSIDDFYSDSTLRETHTVDVHVHYINILQTHNPGHHI